MGEKRAVPTLLLVLASYVVAFPSIFFWSLVGLDAMGEKWASPSCRMALSHLLLVVLLFGVMALLPGGPKGCGINLKNWRRSLVLGVVFGIGFGLLFSLFSFGPKISGWKFSRALDQLQAPENLIQLAAQLFLIGLSEELYFRGVLLTSLTRFFHKKIIGPHSAVMIISLGFASVQFYKLFFGASLAGLWPLFAGAFVYGLVLGEVYLRTTSLLGPALIHGLGNSLLFLSSLGI